MLRCLFIMPYWFCPLNKRFEALVLSLTLLINMVEHCEENRCRGGRNLESGSILAE